MEENRYKRLAGNTLLFAISSFSGKLLSLFVQPYITHAMDEVSDVGVTKLTSQCANLLIPLVGMGISAVIYGYVMTAVVGYTVDMIMAGNQQSSQVFIVTHDYEKMAQAIVDNVHRGVTLIDSQGWYLKKESKIVMVVCRKRETSMILKFVKTIDPEAFMTVGSVMGVYGKGFQTIGKG